MIESQPALTNLRRKATVGAVFTGGAQAFRTGLQMLSVVVLSRLLSPEVFGLMAMISPLMFFVMLFGQLGLNNAIITARTISPAQLSTIFWINNGVAAALALIFAASAPLIAWFYGQPDLIAPVLVLACSILISAAASQHQALITRSMQFGRLALIDVISGAAGFLLALVIAIIYPSIWALVASTVMTALTAAAGSWLASGWRPSRQFNWAQALPMIKFGRGMMGFNVFNFLSRNLDNILIGKFAGAVQLGYYDRAYKLLLFPLSQINQPVGRVVIPILSRLVDEPERYRAVYLRTVQQLALFTLPGVVFMIIYAESAIPEILGEHWRASVPIFVWLGFAALHQPISATTGWLFISQSRTGEFAQWGLVVAVTSIAAFIVGLAWGALGVAAAYALSDMFIRMPIVWYWVGRKGPVRTIDLVNAAWPHVLANMAMALVLIGLIPFHLSGFLLLDLAMKFAAGFAVCWTTLAVFPKGRAVLMDLAGTVGNMLARPARAS
ncbi:lipopolysaccharide biosynthesis protein [Rhizorhapis suberifaciens]|uniref:PST family polysaccharide transporter n=1 Tax=Rhizorhapis suberifaciens TaxID=13656 RepID=A0A840HW48_9SPHN|nr:lipopolysaccharide biosynthesis protein [Rhizorhapis suberifaciens]MBB4641847.1 PST family polysaccharide transporter [Rhizorhapis suberifaciens]